MGVDVRFDRSAFSRIMKQGLPLALNTALYPLANLQIQSAINTFGVSAIAGNPAACTIEGIPAAFNTSINSTAVVFIGQNLGAGDQKRAKQAFRKCMALALIIGVVLAAAIQSRGYAVHLPVFWNIPYADGLFYGILVPESSGL